MGDHYVTRLTHTLEVSQIARTIARALNLNEDLTESIALGHDLGHTPFGHVGEYAMDKLRPEGFKHSRQSLRIVEQLEKDGRGLNLMWETRHGILNHSKPRGEFLGNQPVDSLSLEAQICRISDAVAYLNHDLADSFRAGILTPEALPPGASEVLGETHARRIGNMVSDIVETSWSASGETNGAGAPVIGMSEEMSGAFYTLREFMFDNVYLPESNGTLGKTAEDIIGLLHSHFSANRGAIPPEYRQRSKSEDMAVVDYISGMTDHYAIRAAERISPGIAAPFVERRVV